MTQQPSDQIQRHGAHAALAPGQTPKYHHGRSPASWAGSMIALVGFVIAAVGFFLDLNVPLIVIGLVVAVGGALVGGLMARAGLGQVWE